MSNTNITITVTGISPDDLPAIVAALNKRGGSVTLVAQEKAERAPDAIAEGHNPDRLTDAHVGVRYGWRLLDMDEINQRKRAYKEIQCWRGVRRLDTEEEWDNTGWHGNGAWQTYRTNLTREQLAKLP